MRPRSAALAVGLAAVAAALLLGAACPPGRVRLGAAPAAPADPLPAPPPPAAAPSPERRPEKVLDGSCEASAVVPWRGGWLVGDNESEAALLAYDADGEPTGTVPLAPPVEDVEALAVLPDGRLVVVGSQSANKKGERRPDRERVVVLGVGGAPAGAAAVVPDLAGCPACVAARGKPPKEGGLSIEGAAWVDDALWLGVRSPVPDGAALLLRMRGDPARALEVEAVVPVDLGGLGVRDLAPDGLGGALIVAGPAGAGPGGGALYRWHPGVPAERVGGELPPSSEGVALDPAGGLVLVSDGDGPPGGPCKAPARLFHLAAP